MKPNALDARQIANAIFRPRMYARRTPGMRSGGKTFRIFVAPVTITTDGSTPGALLGSTLLITLMNAACPAEMMKAPPTDEVTRTLISS